MAFVLVCPDALAIAAGQLRHVGSVIAARNAVAAPATAELAPAAADEVSALTATQFNFHAAMYQAVGAQAIAMMRRSSRCWAPARILTRLPKPPTSLL